jgi:hypothetical protein
MPSATREAPQKPAFLAGAERLWPCAFSLQNVYAGLNVSVEAYCEGMTEESNQNGGMLCFCRDDH